MNRELEEIRDKVVPVLRPYVSRVAIFGSFARGEQDAESDIDLLVELKPPGQRPVLGLQWFVLEDELRRVLGRDVEMVSADALSPYIRPYVDRERVVLYKAG